MNVIEYCYIYLSQKLSFLCFTRSQLEYFTVVISPSSVQLRKYQYVAVGTGLPFILPSHVNLLVGVPRNTSAPYLSKILNSRFFLFIKDE